MNDAPVAVATNLNTDENIAQNGLLLASDVDGDDLNYAIVNNASKGTAVITNASTGAYRYTPDASATGADSFIFKVNDGRMDSNVASVSVNIVLVNVAPVTVNSTLNTFENIAVNGILSANDRDGDPLNYSIVENGKKGTAVITNASTGAYRYSPNAGETGTDRFTFKVHDGLVDSDIATVALSIESVNEAPVAMDANLSIFNNAPVTGTLSAVDADGDLLTYSIVSNTSKGSVEISNASTGFYTYTPDTGAVGADSFAYIASDGQADSDIAIVTFQLQQVVIVKEDSAASGGGLNGLFILLLSLLPGLRFIPVGRVVFSF